MAMYKQINDDMLILSPTILIIDSSNFDDLPSVWTVNDLDNNHNFYPFYNFSDVVQTPQNVVIPDPLTENVTHWARGHKRYELTNHLGNVLATVSDRKIPVYANNNFSYYKAEVMTANDYYAFGMAEPKRSFDTSDYRFAFNGKEKIDEVYGSNNFQDYGERMYDPRLCRFPSPDPLIVKEQKYPELSSYQFASNTPIWGVDWDGLEVRVYTEVQGVGHTFITIKSCDELTVYTYGRYLGGDKDKTRSNSLDPTGRGVLLKLTGKEAQEYVKHELKDANAKAFEIKDADESAVKEHFDKMFDSGRPLTKEEAKSYDSNPKNYGTSADAKVLDQYSLVNNNCTTKACEGVVEGGSNVFDMGNTGGSAQQRTYKPFVPSDVQNYLENKSGQSNGKVNDVTRQVTQEVN